MTATLICWLWYAITAAVGPPDRVCEGHYQAGDRQQEVVGVVDRYRVAKLVVSVDVCGSEVFQVGSGRRKYTPGQ
jgi:hypothetical protein